MKIRIVWALGGRIGVQPYIAVSAEDHGYFDDELMDDFHSILKARKPKPESVEIMGGNFEPCVMLKARELHVSDKTPNVVTWAERRLRSRFPEAEYEVVKQEKQ